MIKADYISDIANIVEQFDAEPNEVLSGTKQTLLTNLLAEYLQTVNPTNNYPPTQK